jgi:hypothetical protein
MSIHGGRLEDQTGRAPSLPALIRPRAWISGEPKVSKRVRAYDTFRERADIFQIRFVRITLVFVLIDAPLQVNGLSKTLIILYNKSFSSSSPILY